jgi:hypothetical protein
VFEDIFDAKAACDHLSGFNIMGKCQMLSDSIVWLNTFYRTILDCAILLVNKTVKKGGCCTEGG